MGVPLSPTDEQRRASEPRPFGGPGRSSGSLYQDGGSREGLDARARRSSLGGPPRATGAVGDRFASEGMRRLLADGGGDDDDDASLPGPLRGPARARSGRFESNGMAALLSGEHDEKPSSVAQRGGVGGADSNGWLLGGRRAQYGNPGQPSTVRRQGLGPAQYGERGFPCRRVVLLR